MTNKITGSLLKVLNKMTTPAANNHILHALIPQRLVVQVVNVQMLFAPTQNALAIVMGEKLLPLNLPGFGSYIPVVIGRRISLGQLCQQAFSIHLANPLRMRRGLQNFLSRLFVHALMIMKKQK